MAPAAPEDLARLRWRCRRGMKELDMLLGRWLEAHLQAPVSAAASAELAQFRCLLDLPDPELAAYLLGRETPSDAATRSLVAAITAPAAPPP